MLYVIIKRQRGSPRWRFFIGRLRYDFAMTDFAQLLRIAFKAELADSRRVAAASGVTEGVALFDTLTLKAGSAGLPALVARRGAMLDADADRAAASAARKAAQRNRANESDLSPWRAWFDGSAHPNPGRCGIGAVLRGPSGQCIELSRQAGYGNSSEAEYRALIAVLTAAVDAGASGLTVYGDSKVVIDDVNGVVAPARQLAEYRTQAQALLARLGAVSLRWLPRHKNTEADALSQRAAATAVNEE